MGEILSVGTPELGRRRNPRREREPGVLRVSDGWTSEGDAAFGCYTIFRKDGKLVAGIGPTQEGRRRGESGRLMLELRRLARPASLRFPLPVAAARRPEYGKYHVKVGELRSYDCEPVR